MDEIMKALKHMEVGKAAEYDTSFVIDAEGRLGVYWQVCCTSSLINAGKVIGQTGGICLLYPDDQVILVPSTCGLPEMVNEMNNSSNKSGMKVKTKIVVFERGENKTECDIFVERERVEHGRVCIPG
ncbi:hypothetical protein EVAR_45073_1 [Eumeta japonica]|uniref:Uncharacterized protein n=1 Tax=Eumeta variegata TaxID=151549 RepID=A0A4C1XY42_EUMVA|nr:hypothetical protein EVAR_45073_1 [Eumeta japonica]